MTSTAIHDIDKTNVPDVSLVSELLHLICKYEEQECIPFITGDTFGFPGLAKKYGLHLVEAKAVQFPPEDERDEDIFDNYDLQLKVKIHADTNVFGSSSDDKNKLLRSTQKWLCGRRKEYMKILDQEVTKSEAAFHEVIANVLVESYIASDFIGDVKDSPFFHDFWNKYMNKIITEGVCYAKNMVPDNLRKSLQKHIDELAQKTPVDYHPNSNDVVRDLVHPALYPYIKGVSKLNKGAKLPPKIPEENSDFWGRNYEESKFQWLPTPFKITSERKCLVQEYINNLDQDIFSDLYRDLESLFEICLPFFEEVWSYAKAMEFFQGDDHDHGDESDESPALEKESVSFSGQELQIIVKIVEYTLQPGQSYEGVWHAEGMSHENIVMTGKEYTLLLKGKSIMGIWNKAASGILKFRGHFPPALAKFSVAGEPDGNLQRQF